MSDDLQKDLYGIIENAQQTAIVSVNSVLVIRNWLHWNAYLKRKNEWNKI